MTLGDALDELAIDVETDAVEVFRDVREGYETLFRYERIRRGGDPDYRPSDRRS